MTIQNGDISTYRKTQDDMVAKVTIIKTDSLTLDVYYFKAGQALAYHRHPTGNQIFTVIEGSGTFKLDDGGEESLAVKQGSTFLAPANVWHDLADSGNGKLVAQQVTTQPSGMEKRES
jgi:quercetin dioxygenase-like cupin family protein